MDTDVPGKADSDNCGNFLQYHFDQNHVEEESKDQYGDGTAVDYSDQKNSKSEEIDVHASEYLHSFRSL